MSCCEVCRQAVNAQLQLPSGNQGTCLKIHIKIRKGLGIPFTFYQVLQVSGSLQFSATGNLTRLHGENYEASPYMFLPLLAFATDASQADGTPRTSVSWWWSLSDSETARRCGVDSSCDFPVPFPLFSVPPQSLALFTLQHESFSCH